jgi:uncharacterized protein YkwD
MKTLTEKARYPATALLLSTLVAATASAQEDELLTLVNGYRTSSQTCEGERMPAVGPLAPDPALARVKIAAGEQLPEALKDVGYQAARAQVISVSGPSSPADAMQFIKQRYCRVLSSPQYSAIGISHQGNAWRVVFAQPLLPDDLGEWPTAGKEILKRVNDARATSRTCGEQQFDAVGKLTWNTDLAKAARAHSLDMANRNYFSHKAPDGSDVSDRVDRTGYRWRHVGENIATGQGSPEKVVSGWLSSPGHCANIMNADFTQMGAAFAVNPDSDTTIYWTQVLATPR